jgi:hypothetical protein
MESFQSAISTGLIGLGFLVSLVWAGFLGFEAFKFLTSFI